jgi:hypothetical protein
MTVESTVEQLLSITHIEVKTKLLSGTVLTLPNKHYRYLQRDVQSSTAIWKNQLHESVTHLNVSMRMTS